MACLPTLGTEFRACWQNKPRTEVRRACIVDLNEVTFIDKCGEQLLCYWPKKERSSLPAGPIPNTLLSTERTTKTQQLEFARFSDGACVRDGGGRWCERRVASASAPPAPQSK